MEGANTSYLRLLRKAVMHTLSGGKRRGTSTKTDCFELRKERTSTQERGLDKATVLDKLHLVCK